MVALVTTALTLAFDAGESEDLDVVDDPDDHRDQSGDDRARSPDLARSDDDPGPSGGVEE